MRRFGDVKPVCDVGFKARVRFSEDVVGIITGLLWDGSDWQYRLNWVHDGAVQSYWLYDYEIEVVQS